MITLIKENECIGCLACAEVCPKGCISLKANSYGFIYPAYSENNCIECKKCLSVCPTFNKAKSNTDNCYNESLFGHAVENSVRQSCSSGGLFLLLAKHTIEKGGVVYGASFSDDYKSVSHCSVAIKENLDIFNGAKYLQSDIHTTFKSVKENLDNGLYVLYSGTPCQIAAIKNYIGDNNHLITVDFVCHGVPSPLFWSQYCSYIEQKHRSSIKSVNFRDKSKGWRSYSLAFSLENGKVISKPNNRDPYLLAFTNNYMLRPSCYSCCYKGTCRESDLTLGDAWGIEKILNKHDDDLGTSLILINSDKGKDLLKSIKSEIKTFNVNLDDVVLYNGSIINSVDKPIDYESFLTDFLKLSTNELISKYFDFGLTLKIKDIIRKLISK